MKFSDIPKYTRPSNYTVNVSWSFLEKYLQGLRDDFGSCFEMEPDFQRGHVWTPSQQTAYVEHILAGGKSGRDVYFNAIGWDTARVGWLCCVDGLQRLTAVRGFLADKVPAYGHLFSQYEDKMRWTEHDFVVHINNLDTRAEVLKWYLEMNAGGTPHTHDEIERVRRLLAKENNKPTPFQEALRKAEEALVHIGTGDLKDGPIVREGARAYVANKPRKKKP